jgi:outer membrane protein assembly factor BamB
VARRRTAFVVCVGATVFALLLGTGLQRTLTNAKASPVDLPEPIAAQVLTYHNDVGRTGQNLEEKILRLDNVRPEKFGKVGFLASDGLVDAEPLYAPNLTIGGRAHNAVFVATEHDSVFAFDADTLSLLWHVTVLGVNETPSDDRGCAQVSPEMGITATPVIGMKGDGGLIYVVAMSKDGNGNYYQRLHALDITSGAETAGSPATITATFPNRKGQVTFDAKQYKERASLLLQDGIIYTTWASHCDLGDYTGWIIGYNAETLQLAKVLNVTPNGSAGAIWMSGAGPSADVEGHIYLLDGNGTFDKTLTASGFPILGDFGNAFLKLSARDAKLSVADYFNVHNTGAESNRDEDLGSGGALVLPDRTDVSGKVWQLAVGAGKDKRVYVVNRNSMGKFNVQGDAAIYQKLDNALAGAEFGMPAYFNNIVYFGAVGDALKAFPIANAKLASHPVSMSAATFAYPGTTPSISANGTSNGIVWAVEARGSDAGVLHAYDASNLEKELYSSAAVAGGRDAFADNKFITPMIANGKVYVGTAMGVTVFGLLPDDGRRVALVGEGGKK